ncbi:MAG: hypothetical protein GY757_48605 [bacterium]|nr:hypothetical protein [bacterium]
MALWEKSHVSDFSFDEENNEDYGSINDREKISFAIEPDQTEILSAGCRKSFNSDIEVLLVTALGIVLKDHTGTENILLEMENNGRILDDIDLSRTMGWFTAMFPMLINIDKEDLTSLIKSVKEQLKTIPNSGMGYWLLKNISKKLTGDYKSRVRFNYLGQFDKEISNDLFSHCDAYTGEEIGQENALSTLIEINCMIIKGGLAFDLLYSKKIFDKNTITNILEKIESTLRQMVPYFENEDEVHFTSSDFDTVDLDDDDLAELFG